MIWWKTQVHKAEDLDLGIALKPQIGWECDSVVEHMPGMYEETLLSIPSTAKTDASHTSKTLVRMSRHYISGRYNLWRPPQRRARVLGTLRISLVGSPL